MKSVLQTAAPAGVLMIMLWGASAAQADDPAAPLVPLVVTATRIPTELSQVASSLTLITAEDIEAHQWRTLPDALATTPGLSLTQTGGPGGQTSVFLRGANANHTKVLIDGIDVVDPSEGSFDFGQTLTSAFARVEVLRGPQSSLYGSDALGGVINIVTAEGHGRPRFNAAVEGGSFDTLNETAAVSGSTGGLSFRADIAHAFSGDTPVTPLALLAPGEARIGDRYDNLTASTKLGLAITPDFGLGLVVRYLGARLKTTGENYAAYPAVPDAAQTVQITHQLFVRGEARLSLMSGAFANVLGLGYTDYRTRIQAPDDGFGLPEPIINNGDRLKLDWQGTFRLAARHTLVLGAEDVTERLRGSPIDASKTTRAGFIELQSRPLGGLTIAASVRYDDDDRFGGRATWRVGPTYTLEATGTQLKATYGTGFKSPTLTQLFVSFPAFNFFANPNLRPETSEGYDIGLEQPMAGGAVRLGATWFHNAIRNLIEPNADFTSYDNIGRATTYGIESFIAWRVNGRLSLRGDHTWTVARDDVAAQDLLRRPRQRASLSADWRPANRLSLSATALYTGARIDGNRDFSIPRLIAGSYLTVNLAGSYDLGRGLAVFARIDNLLDRHDQDPVGFQKPGLGVFGGVKVSLP